jgi:hypothetical protein
LFKRYFALLLALLSFPATAQEYVATTTASVAVRWAPNAEASQKGTLPAGTQVQVPICFKEGAYCQVALPDGDTGFVAGGFLAVDGATLLSIEQERWAAIWAKSAAPRVSNVIVSPDIRLEGDSYMGGACTLRIADYLKATTGRRVEVTAVGGSEMSGIRDRILSREFRPYLGMVTVVWDGSPNGMGSATAYADTLGEGIAALGHDQFVVIPAATVPGRDGGAGNTRAADEIFAEFAARWPDNLYDWREDLPNSGGVVDPSQMCDAVHLNEQGLRAVAKGVARFIRSKGW